MPHIKPLIGSFIAAAILLGWTALAGTPVQNQATTERQHITHFLHHLGYSLSLDEMRALGK